MPTPPLIQLETKYFNFPLWVGKEWKGSERIGRWRNSHSKVTGLETIITPAGTFDAYRIERIIRMFEDIYNFYDTEIFFYSPLTQSSVKYDYKREMKDLVGDPKYGLYETVSIELLSYKAE